MSDLPFEDSEKYSAEYGSSLFKINPKSVMKNRDGKNAAASGVSKLIGNTGSVIKKAASSSVNTISNKTSSLKQSTVETLAETRSAVAEKKNEAVLKTRVGLRSKSAKAELAKKTQEKEFEKELKAKDDAAIEQKKTVKANIAVDVKKSNEKSEAIVKEREREKASSELYEEKKRAQLLLRKEITSEYIGDVDVVDESWGGMVEGNNTVSHKQFLKDVGFDEDKDKYIFKYSCSNTDSATLLTKYVLQQWNGTDYENDEIYKILIENVLYGEVKNGPDVLYSYAKDRMATSFSGNAEVIRITKYLYLTSPWTPTLRTSLNGMGVYKSNNSSNVTEVIMTHTQLSLLANLFDGQFLKDNNEYISFIKHEEALDLRVEQIAEYMSYMELDPIVKRYIEECVVLYGEKKFDRTIPKVPFAKDSVKLQQLENFKNLLGEFYKRETVSGPFHFKASHIIKSINGKSMKSKKDLLTLLKEGNPTKDLFTLEVSDSDSFSNKMSPFDLYTLKGDNFRIQQMNIRYSKAEPPILLYANDPYLKLTIDDILSEADKVNLLYLPIHQINNTTVTSYKDIEKIMAASATDSTHFISFVKNTNVGAEEGFFFGNIGSCLNPDQS